jgi:hypothetical protein
MPAGGAVQEPTAGSQDGCGADRGGPLTFAETATTLGAVYVGAPDEKSTRAADRGGREGACTNPLESSTRGSTQQETVLSSTGRKINSRSHMTSMRPARMSTPSRNFWYRGTWEVQSGK